MGELPPGQREYDGFPRFGLSQFAERFPEDLVLKSLRIQGDVRHHADLTYAFLSLPRSELIADFHCVTTWSSVGNAWRGVSFSDFYEYCVMPECEPAEDAQFVVFKAQDGYRTALPLEDLLEDGVLLATELAGAPLDIAHGAPLRLVAPAHYGYKNAKHVCEIQFWRDDQHYAPNGFRFMDHPRARVAFEERGRGLPGWCFRYLYRPLVARTVRQFATALRNHPVDEMED